MKRISYRIPYFWNERDRQEVISEEYAYDEDVERFRAANPECLLTEEDAPDAMATAVWFPDEQSFVCVDSTWEMTVNRVDVAFNLHIEDPAPLAIDADQLQGLMRHLAYNDSAGLFAGKYLRMPKEELRGIVNDWLRSQPPLAVECAADPGYLTAAIAEPIIRAIEGGAL